ncbi:hypothetical protein [Stutzerimonas chloritidismutans]|uniref:Uncharacterized protein n=1 Tax=Stutzerimonas chloritidismutans TaxID=203192 RepID=A0ABU9MET9_STUCH
MNEKIIKQIKKLIYASDAFQQAESLLSHIKENELKVSEDLYNPMMAGVITTYGMNFNKANGLGSLPSFYEEFEDSKLMESHVNIIAARNQLYAHRDIQNTKGHKEGAYKIEVWLESGKLLFRPTMIDISHERISDIKSLITFQRQRLQQDLDKKLAQIIDKSKLYKENVRWELGRDFP